MENSLDDRGMGSQEQGGSSYCVVSVRKRFASLVFWRHEEKNGTTPTGRKRCLLQGKPCFSEALCVRKGEAQSSVVRTLLGSEVEDQTQNGEGEAGPKTSPRVAGLFFCCCCFVCLF